MQTRVERRCFMVRVVGRMAVVFRPDLDAAKALNDYSATDDNDFDFKAGDIIAITHAPPGGRWWRGELLDETRRQPGRDMLLKLYVIELGKPGEALPSPHVRVYTNDGWSVLFYGACDVVLQFPCTDVGGVRSQGAVQLFSNGRRRV